MSTAAPPKVAKAPPEGVERTLQATLRYAIGMPAVTPNTEKAECIEKFFANPLGGQKGFTEITNSWQLTSEWDEHLMAMCLMTKKKKPVGVAMLYDRTGTSVPRPCILLRGDRTKQAVDKYFEMDAETAGHLAASLYTVQPKEPCNFHPWFSSIVLAYHMRHSQPVRTVTGDDVDAISASIRSGRVLVVVCVPSLPSLESTLHKLAIDKSGPVATPAAVVEHHTEWKKIAEANKYNSTYLFDTLKNVSTGVQEFARLVSLSKGVAQAAANPASIPVSDKKAGKQPAAGAMEQGEHSVAVSTDKHKERDEKGDKKTKRDDRYERSGQSKFIADTIEAGGDEDKREEDEQREFERKVKRIKDSDSEDSDDEDGSDSGSESGSSSSKKKKKKKKKKHRHSDDEDELSDSDDDDSEEESDDDSDDDSDEESSSSEGDASATSSDDEDRQQVKKRRLIKTADDSSLDASGRKMTQTTLQLSAAGSSNGVLEQPKRKQTVRPPPAKGNRAGVTARCNLTLDAVETCTGIPLAMVEKTNALMAELREGFKEYESEKFPIKKTYALHTTTFDLVMALRDIINAGLSVEQKNSDASASRRLAISTTSAVLKILPSLREIDSQMKQSMEAIDALQKTVMAIADDFKRSAAQINEE